MRSGVEALKALLSGLLLFAFVQPAHAFFSWQSDHASLELRGLVIGSGAALINPDNPLFYNGKNIYGGASSGRLMLDASIGNMVTVEAHAAQDYVPLRLRSGGSRLVTLQGVERSDLLDWGFAGGRSHLVIDRLNMQLAKGNLVLKAGRQPINLAATFYFTPNDFFAPFAAQTFFRDFKPGVDALRADIQLADLSQLSVIAVAGFRADVNGDNGWSNGMEAAKTSYLARASTVVGDFELALLGGLVRKERLIGGDLQGELFEWLGVRGEGHVLFPDTPGQSARMEIALGVEHRWENSLTIRVEQFYHGGGATTVAGYLLPPATQSFYRARNYTAAGGSYEFTPLLTGSATAIYNWLDHSALVALYALYSLTDESELAVGANLPLGRKPAGASIRSEFGMFPISATIEYRGYF